MKSYLNKFVWYIHVREQHYHARNLSSWQVFFAGRDKDCPFSSRFVDGFLERHKAVLVSHRGTITSPTRWLGTTLEKTKEFISTLTEYMMRNTMNKRNTFVFDETVIGDSNSPPVVIGERRKSGGGNINLLRFREKALGCYIPFFSMHDGSTPFRVFIFKSGCKKQRHSCSTCISSKIRKKMSNTSI